MNHKEYIIPIGEEAKEFDEMFIGVIRKQSELIRCKDCKYMSNEIDQRDGSDVFICNFNRWRRMEGKHRDDFYCADGERKEK